MELAFEKYEGIGNDFVVCRLQNPHVLSKDQVRRICDRHFGIGADGVLIVSPAKTPEARGRMTVINADGSQPEMCGNGLRCVALALLAPKEHAAEFLVETDAGPRFCRVELQPGAEGGRRPDGAHGIGADRSGPRARVTTSLGLGKLLGPLEHEHDGATLTFTRVSMGNPHAVTFAPQLPEVQLDALGPVLSGRVPHGSNVEIATVVGPHRIELSVWERGVGRTLACGTGAAATAVAAVSLGHAEAGVPIEIHLPGGPLELTVSPELEVTLRGPARRVFQGVIEV